MRRFFLDFFDFPIVFTQCEKIFTVFVEPLRSHCFHDQNDLYRVLSRRLSFSTYKLRTSLIRPTRGYLHLRRFFLEFFDFPIVFYQCENFLTVFVEPLRSHCFFISKWFTSCFITAVYFPNVFLPLLAATGAASVPHMRRVFLEFFDLFHVNDADRFFFHGFCRAVAFSTF